MSEEKLEIRQANETYISAPGLTNGGDISWFLIESHKIK